MSERGRNLPEFKQIYRAVERYGAVYRELSPDQQEHRERRIREFAQHLLHTSTRRPLLVEPPRLWPVGVVLESEFSGQVSEYADVILPAKILFYLTAGYYAVRYPHWDPTHRDSYDVMHHDHLHPVRLARPELQIEWRPGDAVHAQLVRPTLDGGACKDERAWGKGFVVSNPQHALCTPCARLCGNHTPKRVWEVRVSKEGTKSAHTTRVCALHIRAPYHSNPRARGYIYGVHSVHP